MFNMQTRICFEKVVNMRQVCSSTPIHYKNIFSDIDECSINADNCAEDGACTNIQGSFTCGCNIGYSGNGVQCTGKLPDISFNIHYCEYTYEVIFFS